MNPITVFILAGGLGTRLQSVVDDVPKPMAPIQGRPFLDYLINHVRVYFAEASVYLLTHHLSEYIEDYYAADPLIHIIKEPARLGTGGAIRYAVDQTNLHRSPLLVMNGDTYHTLHLANFVESGLDHIVTIGTVSVQDCSRYGSLVIKDGCVCQFVEKQPQPVPGTINLGAYMIPSFDALTDCPEGVFSFEQCLETWAQNGVSIGAYSYDGPFIDIGVPEDYQKMNDFACSMSTEI